jgi:hypothetical protein
VSGCAAASEYYLYDIILMPVDEYSTEFLTKLTYNVVSHDTVNFDGGGSKYSPYAEAVSDSPTYGVSMLQTLALGLPKIFPRKEYKMFSLWWGNNDPSGPPDRNAGIFETILPNIMPYQRYLLMRGAD